MELINYQLFQIILLVFVYNTFAQILQPAEWDNYVENTSDGSNIKLIIFKVKLEDDWYVYSSDQDPDLGPTPTKFFFEPHEHYELVGDVIPLGVKEKFDAIWMGDVKYMSRSGEFHQKVKIKGSNPTIKVNVSYQACSNVSGQCILGEEDFEIVTSVQ